MPELTQWDNFYVIVGSSAGALIGLQFVVVALIADVARPRADAQASAAFQLPAWFILRWRYCFRLRLSSTFSSGVVDRFIFRS